MKQLTYLFTILAAVAVIFAACSKKIMFTASPVVPAASGEVKIKKDKNDNYELAISVKHLAPAKKLSPPKEYYIAWMETDSYGIKNIGQITSSSGLLSSTRKASLKTVTAFRPKTVFITAEENANIQYPGNRLVLKTEEFSVK